MFIEESLRGRFLAKKVKAQKISVQILGISLEDAVQALTRKECEIYQYRPEYLSFASELYDETVLQKVLYLTLLTQNLIASDLCTDLYAQFPDYFIYHSNKTEGSRIPLAELQKILAQKATKHPVRNEILEVQNSILVWQFMQKDFNFTLAGVKQAYHLLTRDLLQENGVKYPRGFKKTAIVVNNNVTTPPDKVETAMTVLLSSYRSQR